MSKEPVICPQCRFNNPRGTSFCGGCGTRLPSVAGISASTTETVPTPLRALGRGTVLAGRFEIIEELGRGGMGVVFRVDDRKTHEEVALKLIQPQISLDSTVIERFRREMVVARKISHRNVCRMHDLGEAEGIHFITMEYVAGEDLKSLIKRIGQLPPAKALSIARQTADGLAEAHGLGIVHRDLKPGNIMIDREGNAKIMDFGIARSLKTGPITGTGLVVGTPDYMSPEQAEAADADGPSDIYSLGVILYEMVTGRPPFEGKTPLSVAMKHKGEVPKDPREHAPQLTEALGRLILKCLEKDPAKRPQTAEELRSDLESLERAMPASATVKSPKRPTISPEITVTFKLRKVVIPLLVAAVALGLGLVVWRAAFTPEAEERSIAVITFQNQTGDRAFDYLQTAIPNLLITSLEQSKRLHVTTFERLRDLLRQTGREETEIIDRDLGFELARADGVEALVLGSYVQAGGTFATDIKVFEVRTRKLLKSATAKGDGVQSVLDRQIGQLSREISRGVGLSSGAVEEAGRSLAQKPTLSLDAYKHFLEGQESLDKMYHEDALKSLEQALALDPEFAMAHLLLYRVFRNLGESERANQALAKAMALSSKASDKERLYIEAAYARRIEKNAEKELALLRILAARYPKEKHVHSSLIEIYRQKRLYAEAIAEAELALRLDPASAIVLNQLGYLHIETGELDRAERYLMQAVAAAPGDANPRDSLGFLYFLNGRLDEAIVQYREALRVKPDFGTQDIIAMIFAIKGEYGESMIWLDRFILAAPHKNVQNMGYLWRGIFRHFLGQREQARIDVVRAAEGWGSADYAFGSALAGLAMAFFDFERGNRGAAAQNFSEYLKNGQKAWPATAAFRPLEEALWLGLLAWKSGRTDEARRYAEDAGGRIALSGEERPDLVKMLAKDLVLLKAEIRLSEGKAAAAVKFLEEELVLSIPVINQIFHRNMIFMNFPSDQDVLARACLQAGNPERAIAEYRKLTTFDPGGRDRRLRNPVYHYRLAKLYEQQGAKDDAKREFVRFLELWKDADEGLPELADAKSCLDRLKGP